MHELYIYIYIHTPLVLEYDTSSYIYTEYPLLTIIIIARIRYVCILARIKIII